MTIKKWIPLVTQITTAVLSISGAAIAAYYITAFKTDKFGLYFRDDDQFWFAVGVALMVTAWAIRNWKKTS